jgi:hypothetical protein
LGEEGSGGESECGKKCGESHARNCNGFHSHGQKTEFARLEDERVFANDYNGHLRCIDDLGRYAGKGEVQRGIG